MDIRVHLRAQGKKGTKEWIATPDADPQMINVEFGNTGQTRIKKIRRTKFTTQEEIAFRAKKKVREGYQIVSVHGVFVHGEHWEPAKSPQAPPPEPKADLPKAKTMEDVWDSIQGLPGIFI